MFFGAANSVAVLECLPSVADCLHRRLLPVDLSGARPSGGGAAAGGVDALPSVDLGGGVAPKLAPDGTHVAFSDVRSDVVELMVIATLTRTETKYVTSNPRVLNPRPPTSPSDTSATEWSDSAGLFEFKSFAHGGADATYVQVGGPGMNNPDVWEVNLVNGIRTRLTAYPDWDEDDAPSPDGSSTVIESDRGMHRVDGLGALLPVRDFIDDPESAILAGYLVGAGGSSPDIAALRQCDLQPWLLPASGDRAGRLMGQPLLPYAGGDVHAANNVSGYPQWSPDGTEIALNTQSYTTNRSAPYLLIAHLDDRHPTRPESIVSSAPGPWAPTPADYHGPLGGINHVTVHGLRGGTATIDYDDVKGLFAGKDTVAYDDYTDDGRDVVNGTYSIDDPNLLTGPVTIDADLVMTGVDRGAVHDHLVFSGLDRTPAVAMTGTASASFDGTALAGLPVAPGGCPSALPAPPRLRTTAKVLRDRSGVRQILVHVTSSIGGAGPNEAAVDTRPVVDATVALGSASTHTDSAGRAKLPISAEQRGIVTIRTTAGDALAPAVTQLDLSNQE